jgi:hypothetical protein
MPTNLVKQMLDQLEISKNRTQLELAEQQRALCLMSAMFGNNLKGIQRGMALLVEQALLDHHRFERAHTLLATQGEAGFAAAMAALSDPEELQYQMPAPSCAPLSLMH